MHVKRLEPLRLSGLSSHPYRDSFANIGGERQGKFHVRGCVPGVVSGVPLPLLRQGTKT